MAKSNIKILKKTPDDADYKSKVLDYIKQEGSPNIIEMEKDLKISRQTLRNNLRKLCRSEDIRPYIKITHDRGYALPQDNEVYFTVKNSYQHPQDIIKLINKMFDD